jgi:hypothetical protein
LKEVGIQWNKNKSIEIAMHTLKNCIDQYKNHKTPIDKKYGEYLKKHTSKNSNFEDMIQLMKKNEQYLNKKKMNIAPDAIDLIGSYLLRAVAKPYQHVDISLTLPAVRISLILLLLLVTN